ncbi:MAG: 16S rRNA (cytidine(1402)-2'-O)-methyltransferase [Verrucomicrobiota bacterium]|nr:16S rRNA (cytidine(1402)-2'-O)-methyltransferase [Verrucomicrobiota bacterium]
MLYLVATPIGNLGDITRRAIDVLSRADVIAAEDTRHSGILLRHLELHKPLVSYHEHNEAQRTSELLARLRNGETVAIISDAGTPGISDPGHRLLRACIEEKIPYSIIPGASAILTAMIGSGFPADRFFYGGFLPVKSGQREREIVAAASRAETSIFFESPHRLLKSLAVFVEKAPERILCVARELTKQFEEYRIGSPRELLDHFTAAKPRGEITLLVRGLSKKEARELTADD